MTSPSPIGCPLYATDLELFDFWTSRGRAEKYLRRVPTGYRRTGSCRNLSLTRDGLTGVAYTGSLVL